MRNSMSITVILNPMVISRAVEKALARFKRRGNPYKSPQSVKNHSPYDSEQRDFITYMYTRGFDMAASNEATKKDSWWDCVEFAYNILWVDEQRTKGGLQSWFYRFRNDYVTRFGAEALQTWRPSQYWDWLQVDGTGEQWKQKWKEEYQICVALNLVTPSQITQARLSHFLRRCSGELDHCSHLVYVHGKGMSDRREEGLLS